MGMGLAPLQTRPKTQSRGKEGTLPEHSRVITLRNFKSKTRGLLLSRRADFPEGYQGWIHPLNISSNNGALSHFLAPGWGFPDSSVDKESTCNAGDPSSISGLGKSTGEGIGYPLQYSWASLVAQLVKRLPARWEIRVWSLGWEDPLEKGKATHSSILAWRIPWTIQSQRVGHDWVTFTFTFSDIKIFSRNYKLWLNAT